MGCISIALSEDGKYFLTRNTTCEDNEKDIKNASLDELQNRMNVCKEFYDRFKKEFDKKVEETTSW